MIHCIVNVKVSQNKAVKRIYTASITQSYQIKITAAACTTSSNSVFTTGVTDILTKFAFAFIIKLRRHRSITDTCFISFKYADNLVKVMRSDSTARSSAGSTRSSRTYIRISSAVKVKHCALSTFKQNVFAFYFVHFCSHVYAHTQKPASIFIKVLFIFAVKFCHFFLPVQICKANPVAMSFFCICNSHSATCCSDRAFARSITFFIHFAITRQN